MRRAGADRAFARRRPIPAGDVEKVRASLDDAIDEGRVPFIDVVRARYWQSHKTRDASAWKRLGEEQYGRLLATFDKANGPNVPISIFGRSGLGVYRTDELQYVILVNALRFDWSEAQALMDRIDAITERTQDWWGSIAKRTKGQRRASAITERQRILTRCFGLMSSVFAAVDRENPPDGRRAAIERSAAYRQAITALTARIEQAETDLADALQRSAQMFYGRGMFWGAGGVAVAATAVGAALWHFHVPAEYGVAFPAGAIGAIVSVLQRMGSSNPSRRLSLDPSAGQRMLAYYGAIRAVVGGVLGYAIFVFLKGSLFPALSVSTTAPLATFAGLGFLGGLNERWAQDMIAGSAKRLQQDLS